VIDLREMVLSGRSLDEIGTQRLNPRVGPVRFQWPTLSEGSGPPWPFGLAPHGLTVRHEVYDVIDGRMISDTIDLYSPVMLVPTEADRIPPFAPYQIAGILGRGITDYSLIFAGNYFVFSDDEPSARYNVRLDLRRELRIKYPAALGDFARTNSYLVQRDGNMARKGSDRDPLGGRESAMPTFGFGGPTLLCTALFGLQARKDAGQLTPRDREMLEAYPNRFISFDYDKFVLPGGQ